MCGICGYVENKNITEDKTIFDMAYSLTHRGPDATNIFVKNNVALGHTRLSIRDLNRGAQPFTRIINGTYYTIVYNGELYNLDEIKSDLLAKGYDFLTTSDTEVMLLAYVEYGKDILTRLNGIFAFVVYNQDSKEIFLARDKLGIKPLFYYNNDTFIFASEIKAILKHKKVEAKVSKDELCEIFGLGPAHTPGKTFFKDIYEILPGHYAVYSNNNFYTKCYWDLKTTKVTDSIDESITKIKLLVEDSLKRQLISDVPVCSMLSGGLDSSVLSYLASKHIKDLHTFSIDFDGNDKNFKGSDYQPTKDSDYVKIMKDFLMTNHTELKFSTDEIYNSLKDSMIARDMPGMADVDSSMLVFCKKIHEQGFKVAISGECSDEIFGGYPWYYKEELIASDGFPWARSTNIRAKIINEKLVDDTYLKSYIRKSYNSVAKNIVYDSDDIFENTFRKTCYTTIKWFMNTLIERTDRMSMMSGLEVRVPFADYRIFEYVYNVCAKYKLGLTSGNSKPCEKYLLRKAFEKELPLDIVYRKKSPFPKTYDPKYIEILENAIKDIINKSTSPILEIINVKYLYELLDTHGKNLTENWFGQLMTYPETLAYLIQINMWLEEYNITIEI